jgi:VWFA-related protein
MKHKTGKWIIALLALIAVCVVVMPLVAQKADQPSAAQQKNSQPQNNTFTFSVKTNLVLVPVIVTDKHGQHIPNLTAEDFEVKEDGAAQKISRIDELTSESSKVERPALQAGGFSNELISDHPKKLEIILMDQINTPFASTADANRGLLNYLAKNVDSNTLLTLVAMRGDGVHLIHNFTSDTAALVAAIRKAQSTLNVRDTSTQSGLAEGTESDHEVAMIQALLAPVEFSGGMSGAQNAATARAGVTQAQAQVDASRQNQYALITLESLQQLSQYFARVPGRKSLIWASTAFPFRLGGSLTDLTKGTTDDAWQRTFRMLLDANIAVYPVDVGGLTSTGSATANTIQNINSGAIQIGGAEGGVAARSNQLALNESGAFVDPAVGRHETMHTLADMTGGEAFYNSNDLTELFRRAAEDCSQYYMLAYSTSNAGKAGWRKLSVKVRKDGAKVRARTGFYYRPAGANADVARQTDEMMAMTSDLSFTSLPLNGHWVKTEPAGDQRKVGFALSIPPGVPMIDADHDRHISLDFRVVATDSSGKTAATIGQRMETNLTPDDAKQIQDQGLDYANQLTLPPGEYKVHFVVRDNLRETIGSVVTPLKVQ